MFPTSGPFCPICGGHSAPTVVQNGPPGTIFFLLGLTTELHLPAQLFKGRWVH